MGVRVGRYLVRLIIQRLDPPPPPSDDQETIKKGKSFLSRP